MIEPITIGCVENWHVLASRKSREFAITRIEFPINERLWQINVFPIRSLWQINSFYQQRSAMENDLIESITHTWLAARVQVSTIFFLNLPFQIEENYSALQQLSQKGYGSYPA